MSFLKQLLKPFIEFDEQNPAGPPVQWTAPVPPQPTPAPPAKPAPSKPAQQQPAPVRPVPPGPPRPASPQPAPVQPAPKQPAPLPPATPSTHPLINPSGNPAAQLPAEVPAYSPSGTLIEPFKEHVAYFEKLIDDANRTNPLFKGADFKEFVDSRMDIDDIADEELRYETAFNILKGSGLTRARLLETGQEYINLIGRDLNAFQTAHAQQHRKAVGDKEALLRKKTEELQQLLQRVAVLKGEINQISAEIGQSTEGLNTTRSSFLLAGEKKQQEIDAELQKIVRYF